MLRVTVILPVGGIHPLYRPSPLEHERKLKNVLGYRWGVARISHSRRDLKKQLTDGRLSCILYRIVENPSPSWWKSLRLFGREARTTPRARRFSNISPVRYRRVGETAWSQGGTSNCSLSGVLFKADRVLAVDTPVEMTFVLPLEIAANPRAVVFCRGRIIRSVMPAVSDGQPRLAATILEYLPKTEWKPERVQISGGRGFVGRNQAFDPAKILPVLFPRISMALRRLLALLQPCPAA